MKYVLGLLLSLSIVFQISEAEDLKMFALYQVKKEDTLWKITKGDKELIEFIKRVNRIDEFHLQPGQKILIPLNESAKNFVPVPKYLDELKQSKRVVVVFLKDQYFGFYRFGKLVFWGPISSGSKRHPTPTGKFKVLWKSRKYYSKKYKASMPYALCISNKFGVFLHTQALPGKPASHGCIRLLKSDAKRLFHLLNKGDEVIVK